MKKILLPIVSLVALIGSFVLIKYAQKSDTSKYTIGILQTASHPALDAAREGFVTTLKEKLGDKVGFIVQNAQGSIAQAHSIAQQFHTNKKINIFYTIATPAAQAMHSVEQTRPILFAAVTDPEALGFVSPTTNITGVNDMINVKAGIAMFRRLVPTVQKVGILYTAGETNSLAIVQQMHEALRAQGFTYLDFAISNESDVQAIVDVACRNVDLIITPTDNAVASTITNIAATALKYKKPLIVSDNMLVRYGALAARGVDYRASGEQVANFAYEILVHGKKPYELPIEQAASEKIYINKATLAALGLLIPISLQEQAPLVIEEE